MTEEQKAQALALYRNERIRAALGNCPTRYTRAPEYPGGPMFQIPVPNLADETGEVEGRLHRVLERLVGAAVELVTVWPDPFSGPRWTARKCDRGPFPSCDHPTRLDAIVAALLSLGVARGPDDT